VRTHEARGLGEVEVKVGRRLLGHGGERAPELGRGPALAREQARAAEQHPLERERARRLLEVDARREAALARLGGGGVRGGSGAEGVVGRGLGRLGLPARARGRGARGGCGALAAPLLAPLLGGRDEPCVRLELGARFGPRELAAQPLARRAQPLGHEAPYRRAPVHR
jgi:hypothetical protein